MTIYKTTTQIRQSLLYKIDQLSNSNEQLNVMVQIEQHDDLYDTVVMLLSNGALIVDETYTADRNEMDAKVDAQFLLNSVWKWTVDENVIVNQKIEEICF